MVTLFYPQYDSQKISKNHPPTTNSSAKRHCARAWIGRAIPPHCHLFRVDWKIDVMIPYCWNPMPTGTKFVFQFGSEKVTFPSLGPNHQPMGRFRLHVWQSGMLNRLQAPTKKGIIYPWFWRIHGGFKYIENDTFNMVVAFGLPSSGPNTLQSKLAGGDTIPNNRWFRFALWIWIPSFPGICFFYFDPHYWVTNIDPEYLLQAKSI